MEILTAKNRKADLVNDDYFWYATMMVDENSAHEFKFFSEPSLEDLDLRVEEYIEEQRLQKLLEDENGTELP